MTTKLLLSTFFILFCTGLNAQIWDEGTDGDLSNDGSNPSGVFVLEFGIDNTIIANQVGNPRDVDFFAFTVPQDFELQELVIEDYQSADNVAFMGIDSGVTTDVDFMNPMTGDLLGGATYGTASIGNDILPVMGNLGGATGFTPPLPAGDYTIWLNQTGLISEVTLNLVLGEVLGVDDNEARNRLSIHPNPTQGNLQVLSTESIENIELYTILGKEIMAIRNSSAMDISGLADGIYLARITTTSGTTTKKIIKQ